MSKLRALSAKVRSTSVGDARVRAHAVFDELWQSGQMTRTEAYGWLCAVMGKTEEEGHISCFDVQECELLIQKVQERQEQRSKGKIW